MKSKRLESNIENEMMPDASHRAVVSHWMAAFGSVQSESYERQARGILPSEIFVTLKEQGPQGALWQEFSKKCLPSKISNVPFPPRANAKFTFIDLFAGIGGFHQAMENLGGRCVFASEFEPHAQQTYARNYGIFPFGDITKISAEDIPDHDVFCAGFPCQPFSKAGKQLGFSDKTKGTLFFDVVRILKAKIDKGAPARYIILENVRNLVSHDGGRTWRTIAGALMEIGYRLTPEPLIISPHHLGVPQLRERVVILGVYEPTLSPFPLEVLLPAYKEKSECDFRTILESGPVDSVYNLKDEEIRAIEMWEDFRKGVKERVIGFPIFADYFRTTPEPGTYPQWHEQVIVRNQQLYRNNKDFLDRWFEKYNDLKDFIPAWHKMEWQAGDSADSLWDCLMQRRQSGLRVKRADCAPALVAVVQIPIVGPRRRRMTVREAARLQSFPDEFVPDPIMYEAYKQFGNAVNVKVIQTCAAALFRMYGSFDLKEEQS